MSPIIAILTAACCVFLLWAICERNMRKSEQAEHKSRLDAVSEASAELALRHIEMDAVAAETIERLEREHRPVANLLPPTILEKAKAKAAKSRNK